MTNQTNISRAHAVGVGQIAHILAAKKCISTSKAPISRPCDLAESNAATKPVIDDDVNVVRVMVEPGWKIYQYRVDFQPSLGSKFQKIRHFHGNGSSFGPARVYDGDALFLPHRLPSSVVTVTSEDDEAGGEEKHAFLNLFFREMSRLLSLIDLQRLYFNPNSPIISSAEKSGLAMSLPSAKVTSDYISL